MVPDDANFCDHAVYHTNCALIAQRQLFLFFFNARVSVVTDVILASRLRCDFSA